MNGTHRPDGIFIAAGFEDLPDEQSGGFSLVDIAPTVLSAMGTEPLSQTTDGAVLTGAHREYTLEEERLVAARLRAMGYLE